MQAIKIGSAGTAQIWLEADAVGDDLQALSFSFSVAGPPLLKGRLGLQQAIVFPRDLVVAAESRLKTWDEIGVVAEAAARRRLTEAWDDLLKRLGEQQLSFAGAYEAAVQDKFFDAETIASRAISASLSLDVAGLLLPGASAGDKPVLIVKLDAGAAFSVTHPLLAAVDRASIAIEVSISRQGLLEMLPRIGLPDFPSLDLQWPRMPMPTLSLGGLSLPNLSGLFSLPIPSFGGKLPMRLDFTLPLQLALTLANNDIALTTMSPGNARLLVDPGAHELAEITGISVGFAGGNLTVDFAMVQATHTVKFQGVNEFGADGPLKMTAGEVTVISDISLPAGARPIFSFTLTLGRLEVRSRRNPARVLAVSVTIAFVLTDGTLQSSLQRLALIEPYPFELVAAAAHTIADGTRQLLSFIQSLSVPAINAPSLPGVPSMTGLLSVLRRLGELFADAGEWLAEQGVAAARGLAGLAEAALRLIGDAIAAIAERIGQLAQQVAQAIVIEVRIDAKTWQLAQVIITPLPSSAVNTHAFVKSFLGLKLEIPFRLMPALVYDAHGGWVALAVQPDPLSKPQLTLSTDLWLEREGTSEPAESVSGSATQDASESDPLISLKVGLAPNSDRAMALVLLRNGKASFFRKLQTGMLAQEIASQLPGGGVVVPNGCLLVGSPIVLRDESFDQNDLTTDFEIDSDRLLSIFRSPKRVTQNDSAQPDGLLKQLQQSISIRKGGNTTQPKNGQLSLPLELLVRFQGNEVKADASLQLDLHTLSARIEGGGRFLLALDPEENVDMLGMTGRFEPAAGLPPPAPGAKINALCLDLSDGNPRLELDKDAALKLVNRDFSRSGGGLGFNVERFSIGSGGLDLAASTIDEPVTLAGVDMPFRLHSGKLVVERSRIQAFALTGYGNLPPALVGEAKATVKLNFGEEDGRLALQACEAVLDKGDEPLRCENTRFSITISKLGLKFVRSGGYHFYFTVTGSAEFRPREGEFAGGLLKNLARTRIELKEAPLTSDASVLLQHIEFQIPVDPPAKTNFFDIFRFELRGVGFHPASPAFGGTPALSISGQVDFTDFGDVVTPRFDFHKLWIAPPKSGDSLPRVSFDGLGVGLRLGATAEVYGTARAVDSDLPTLESTAAASRGVTAKGFIASGTVQIKGWASMSMSMSFFELEKVGRTEKRHSIFLSVRQNDLAEKIPTPIGTLFAQEADAAVGYGFELAGLEGADSDLKPRETIKLLDEASKLNFASFESWRATYDNRKLTLALRALISFTSVSTPQAYNEEEEKELPNPVLFDVVAALRTDLTFIMNIRAWVAYNYNDWRLARTNPQPWTQQPSLRGYMYLSAPKSEFLARAVYDPGAPIGEHPKLPDELVKAMQAVRWTSTLYVRPGLFHMEFGWPYQLGITLGKPEDNFYLLAEGGVVTRIEDGAMLQGIAIRAKGHAKFDANSGGDVGAAVRGQADFAIGAKLISYLSSRINDSMFYGQISIEVSVHFSVDFWLRSRWLSASAGFSETLTIQVAVELVVSPKGLAAQIQASVSVSAFGRRITLGVGFGLGPAQLLNDARALSARFLALGLGADYPDPEQGVPVAAQPLPEPSRSESAAKADERVEERAKAIDAQPLPAAVSAPPEQIVGVDFGPTAYWALLFPLANVPGHYLVQMLPKGAESKVDPCDRESHFFAAPLDGGPPRPEYDFDGVDVSELEFLQMEAGQAAGRTLWTARFGRAIAGADTRPTLNQLFRDGCFMESNAALELTDIPPAAVVDAARVPDSLGDDDRNQQAAAARSHAALDPLGLRAAQIEEVRGAFLGTVGQCAAELSRAVSGQTGNFSVDLQAIASLDFDPRALGLTFIASEATLDKVFPDVTNSQSATPRNSTFEINTRIPTRLGGGLSATVQRVQLFNPPQRMFERSQPRLANSKFRRTANGIQLYWDLEPGWGTSQSVYDDPEYQLAHYRIERRVLGASEAPAPRIRTTKPAALNRVTHALDSVTGTSTLTWQQQRSRLQFVDDLSDLPPALRARLLPEAPPAQTDAVQAPEDDRLELVYVIVPVDIASTSGLRSEITVLALPQPRIQPALVRANATVCFPLPMLSDDTGTTASKPVLPSYVLLLFVEEVGDPLPVAERPDRIEIRLADPALFRLRLVAERTVASGVYGADAITQARTRVATPDRERDSAAGVADLLLKPLPDSASLPKGSRVTIVVQRTLKPGRDAAPPASPAPQRYYLDDETALLSGLGMEDLSNPVRGVRMYLRPALSKGYDVRAEWTAVEIRLQVGPVNSGKPAPVDIATERFESVTHASFKPLGKTHMEADANRLHIYYPARGATLSGFIESKPLQLLRDPEGRSAVKLRWDAWPDLELADPVQPAGSGPSPSFLASIVGGYDVFSIDTAAVPAGVSPLLHVDHVGRVQRLPQAMKGQDPAETGDLARVETRYPSDTIGQLAERADTKKNGAWYSPAESFLAWPERVMRRSAIVEIDNVELEKLFECGSPELVVVRWHEWKSIRLPDDGHQPPAPTFSAAGDGWRAEQREDGNLCVTAAQGPFTADLLRRLLLALVVKPDPAEGGRLDGQLRATRAMREIRIAGYRNAPAGPNVSTGEASFRTDLTPQQHPLVADVMAFIRYERIHSEPRVVRRYEPVVESPPPINASTLSAFLDQTDTDRDPSAWGVLRSFGLASSFRLFDTDTGDYASGEDTLNLLSLALNRVLPRYDASAVGAPFACAFATADVLTEVSSHHGAVAQRSDATERVRKDTLGLVQFELRPLVRQFSRDPALRRRAVRYAKLVVRPPLPQAGAVPALPWTKKFKSVRLRSASKDLLMELLPRVPTPGNSGKRALLLYGWEGGATFPKGGRESLAKRLTFEPDGGRWPKDGVLAFVRVLALSRAAEVQGEAIQVGNHHDYRLFLEFVDEPAESLGNTATPWGAFGDLPDEWLAAAMFGDGTPNALPAGTCRVDHPACTTLLAVTEALQRNVKQSPPEMTRIPPTPSERLTLAGKLAAWSRRFMDHGPDAAVDPRQTGLSLALLTRPNPWRVAPDAANMLGVLLLEKSRYGSTRKYAVRPFGRYESLSLACRAAEQTDAWARLLRPRVFDGKPANEKQFLLDHFVDVSIHRTAPLAPPVILASRRLPGLGAPGAKPVRSEEGMIEVLLSRHPEEIASDANITTDSGIAMRHVAVSFWREFSAPDWANRVMVSTRDETYPHIDSLVLEPFGPLAGTDRPVLPALPAALRVDADGNVPVDSIRAMQERDPDLWRGAYALRMTDMPYGFRFVAAAHAAAGVVVSRSSVAELEGVEGRLALPWAGGAAPRGEDTVWQQLPVGGPTWTGVRDDANNAAFVRIEIPLVRLFDNMRPEAHAVWFGQPPRPAPALYRLPDPAVSYRIALESDDASSRSVEMELSAIPDPAAGETAVDETALYLVQKVGPRFGAPPAPTLSLQGDPAAREASHYTLTVHLQVLGRATIEDDIPFAPTASHKDMRPKEFMLNLGDFRVWLPYAPVALTMPLDALVITPPGLPDVPFGGPLTEWTAFKISMETSAAHARAMTTEDWPLHIREFAASVEQLLMTYAVDRVAHWPGPRDGDIAQPASVSPGKLWIYGFPVLEGPALRVTSFVASGWVWPDAQLTVEQVKQPAREQVARLFDSVITADSQARLRPVLAAVLAAMMRVRAEYRRREDEAWFAGLAPVSASLEGVPAHWDPPPRAGQAVDLSAQVHTTNALSPIEVDAAFAELEDIPFTAPTLNSIAGLREPVNATNDDWPIDLWWSAQEAVLETIKAAQPTHPVRIQRMWLRRPATVAERDAMPSDLRDLATRLNSDFLLGSRKRLRLQVLLSNQPMQIDDFQESP